MTKEKQSKTKEVSMYNKVGTLKDQFQKINWTSKEKMKEHFVSVHYVVIFLLLLFSFWDVLFFLLGKLF